MKIVVYWFILILSFQIAVILLLELVGGSYNIISPPSIALVLGFCIVMTVLSVVSIKKLLKIYRHTTR